MKDLKVWSDISLRIWSEEAFLALWFEVVGEQESMCKECSWTWLSEDEYSRCWKCNATGKIWEQKKETNDWIDEAGLSILNWLLNYHPAEVENDCFMKIIREAIAGNMPKATIEDGTGTSVDEKDILEVLKDVYHERISINDWLRRLKRILPTGDSSREVDRNSIIDECIEKIASIMEISQPNLTEVRGAMQGCIYLLEWLKTDVLPTAQPKAVEDASVVDEAYIKTLWKCVEEIYQISWNKVREIWKQDIMDVLVKYLPHTTVSTPLKPLDVDEVIERMQI